MKWLLRMFLMWVIFCVGKFRLCYCIGVCVAMHMCLRKFLIIYSLNECLLNDFSDKLIYVYDKCGSNNK